MKYLILFLPLFAIGVNAQDLSLTKKTEKLLKAYPNCIAAIKDNQVVFKDGSALPFDDGVKNKSAMVLLDDADIEDQLYYSYKRGTNVKQPQKWQDAGRVRNEAFFKKMYGETEAAVEANLVEITWCPKIIGQKIKVTKVNGVDKALTKISEELDNYPEYKKYISDIGGTFTWRKISGTNRISTHSFGMTIDINVKQSHYWQWDCKCKEENSTLHYRNWIPMKIVEIFEKNGFIWGGKWYHYDTMHFEYRPELLD